MSEPVRKNNLIEFPSSGQDSEGFRREMDGREENQGVYPKQVNVNQDNEKSSFETENELPIIPQGQNKVVEIPKSTEPDYKNRLQQMLNTGKYDDFQVKTNPRKGELEAVDITGALFEDLKSSPEEKAA